MILADMCISIGAKIFLYFLYVRLRIRPNIKAYIIFIKDIWIKANIVVVIIIDFFMEYLFVSLLQRIQRNNISSQIGPIIPEVIIANGIDMVLVATGLLIRNIIIFKNTAIDMPNNIKGKYLFIDKDVSL